MKWVIGALVFVQIAAASLRFLCLIQNNNYKLTFSGRFISFTFLNAGLLVPSVLFAFFLNNSVLDAIIGILYRVLAVGIIIYAILGYRTKPRFTKRATAVYLLSLILYFITIILVTVFISAEKIAITAACAVGIFAPLFTAIAIFVLNPYYERKNDKFIVWNCRKIQESHAIRIGITGSYGKTSCKNILRDILERKYSVVCTEKNFNTPMGIALTAEKMTGREEIFIAEMGARKKGDIKLLADLVKPDYSITTGVCPQHMATFKSLHNIFSEKAELYKNTKQTSVFNGNDKYALKMYKECKGKKIKVCVNKEGGVYADEIVSDSDGSKFTLHYGNETLELQTKLLGKHNVINIALCAALGLELNVPPQAIADAVKELKPVPHRLEYSFANGIHILDDSYNSNPVGIKCALEVLDSFGTRKIVLAQGLVEGGKDEKNLNRSVGNEIARHADAVILCGSKAKYISEGLAEGGFKGEIYRYKTLKQAQAHFKEILRTDDALLLQNDLPDVY